MRRLFILPLALLLLVTLPGRAFAHGLGRSQDLPLPFWLYLFAAAAVLLVSFVQIVLFVDDRHTLYRYPRFNLLRFGPLRAVLTNGPFLLGLRALSVALFLLVVLCGLLGRQGPGYNFAPTFVWIIWWVGLGFFTAFVGNVWRLVNPWKVLFEWAEGLARRLGASKGLELGEPYPARLGVWPALVLYAVFIWIENNFTGSAVPLNIALLTLLYSLLTWTGMVVFGKDVWLQRGEAFSVLYGIIARFAPTEVRVKDPGTCQDCGGDCQPAEGGCVNCYGCFARAAPEDRELNLRPPAIGLLSAGRITYDRVVFVVFVLASVTYDSALGTPPAVALQRITSMPQVLGLVALPLFFLVVYLAFVKLSQLFSGGCVPFGRFAAEYVYSIVPIAIAYQVAHYYTYLFIQGQAIIALVSDPFGWGWDLFGTADHQVNAALIGADTVWYTQVALIVAGHVVAVYLAHVIALRLLGDTKLAARSQYPMLGLMILYTVFSLWILSQPIVEESRNEANLESAPPEPTPTTTQTAPLQPIRQPPMPDPSNPGAP